MGGGKLLRALGRVRTQAAAVGLLAAAAVLPAAPGAHAESSAGSITFRAAGEYYIPTAHSAYDGDSRFQFEMVAFGAGPGDRQTPAHDVRVTIDVSAFAGKVRLTGLGYHCTAGGADGLVATCDRGTVEGLDTLTMPLVITPLAGAPTGFAGDIAITATASDAPTATHVVHAVIGRPHLVTQKYPPRTDLAPGSTVSFRPVIGNTGEVPTRGGLQVLFFSSGPMDTDGPRFSNCHYATQGSGAFWCRFDQDLAPGTAYTPDAPIAFRTRRSTMNGSVSYLMFPPDTQSSVDLLTTPGGTPAYPQTGDGPPLTLTPAAPAGLSENTGGIGVTTTQYADYQAVGGTITGAPGQTVEMRLGVRNDGPGGFDPHGADPGGGFDVTMPAGVTVTSVFGMDPPDEQVGWYCGKAGAAQTFHCDLRQPLVVGDFVFYRFEVRIDRAVPGAAGRVKVVQPTALPTRDRDAADDVAPLLVHVEGSTPTGTPTSTPSAPASASPSPGTGGTAGSGTSGGSGSAGGTAQGGATGDATTGGTGALAHTGAGGVRPLAVLAALALALGAVAFAVPRVRRRRG